MFRQPWLSNHASTANRSARARTLGVTVMRATLSTLGLILMIVVSAASLKPNPFGPTSPIRLTEQDSGRTIEVRMGDQLDIVLDDYTTQGHGWERVEADYQIVSIPHPAYTRYWGGGGRTWFAVTADQPGRSRITIAHDDVPTEPPIAPFTVEVVVR